ncbi:MAG: hypothetical protein ABIR58_03775 [Gemmatimonadaceae bacterium]
MTELLIGTVLALAALSFVLYPLLASSGGTLVVDERTAAPNDGARNSAVDALREIEFDRATGKLSDSDYDSLKASYTQRAVEVMRAGSAYVCENCGPRPENGAVFCSNCGAVLA